jgi:hypothetical protein
MLRVRSERQYGPIRICLYLQRFHQVSVSVPRVSNAGGGRAALVGGLSARALGSPRHGRRPSG